MNKIRPQRNWKPTLQRRSRGFLLRTAASLDETHVPRCAEAGAFYIPGERCVPLKMRLVCVCVCVSLFPSHYRLRVLIVRTARSLNDDAVRARVHPAGGIIKPHLCAEACRQTCQQKHLQALGRTTCSHIHMHTTGGIIPPETADNSSRASRRPPPPQELLFFLSNMF